MPDAKVHADLAAERAVLAALLIRNDALADIPFITPKSFYRANHGHAFAAIAALHARGEPADILTLVAELERAGHLAACGGPARVTAVLDATYTAANIVAHARLVHSAYVARRRQHIGRELANGAAADPEHAARLTAALAALEREADPRTPPAESWASLSLSGTSLAATEFPPLHSWIGGGVLLAGELAFLAGHSGVGKTFFAVQLMSALSTGHTLCGLTTATCRVGLLELEMPWQSVQKRVGQLYAGDLERMAFLCEPPEAAHVANPAVQTKLIAFVRAHALDVLIIDPFNRVHDADENSGSDMGHVFEGLHAIRRETGAAILMLHHVRKQPAGFEQGRASRVTSLDSLRGSSRLTNDVSSILSLEETRGLVRLAFTKVRHEQEPTPIYLKRNSYGFFDVVDDPATATLRRKDALEQMLSRAGDDGITAELAAEILKVTPRTVRRDLESLGAQSVGSKRHGLRWVLPIEAPTPTDQELPL